MKTKQVVCLIAFILLVLIIPGNVSAKELSNEKVVCKYIYNDTELTYKVNKDVVELPFDDGENNWYHSQDFAKIYLESSKENSINYVCPTITIEESSSFTTVFNNPKNEQDCNGKCTTLSAEEVLSKENITVKKAVDTTAISSVGIYNDGKYFIPYFRLLEDGTKEWSINGKKYVSLEESITIKTSTTTTATIKLDENLVNKIFKNNKLTSNITIYRNVKETSKNNYEYLLSTKEISSYNLKDGQETAALSYVGAFGDNNQQNMDGWLEGYDQTQNCGETGLLGNVNDENSVAWLLQRILNYLKIIGPMIVVVMSGVDFAKVIVTSDDEGMKKAQKKLITRLLLAASLFFLPELVVALLDIFGITSDATCGLT